MGVISQETEVLKHTIGNVPDQCCSEPKNGDLSAGQSCFKPDRAGRCFKSSQTVTLSLPLHFPTSQSSRLALLAIVFKRMLEVITFASSKRFGPLEIGLATL
jgi:hypothetical protein